jgi:superfamily II helicase
VSLVKDGVQDLWKATSGPFFTAGEAIGKNFDIITSGTATVKEQFRAAQAIIGQGGQLFSLVTNLQNFSPEQLINQYSTTALSNASSQFASALDKDSALLSIKGDVKNLLGGFANNVSQTFSDLTLPMNEYINKITDNFALAKNAAALEISQQIIDLRAQGWTEAEIKEILPNLTTEALKKFSKSFEGAPATSNQIQDDYETTGLIRT